jgi:hypothetical protein
MINPAVAKAAAGFFCFRPSPRVLRYTECTRRRVGRGQLFAERGLWRGSSLLAQLTNVLRHRGLVIEIEGLAKSRDGISGLARGEGGVAVL